jgi:hypothetical protein
MCIVYVSCARGAVGGDETLLLGGLDGLLDQLTAHVALDPVEDRSQRCHDRQPSQPPGLLVR